MRSVAIVAIILAFISSPAHAGTPGGNVENQCRTRTKSHVDAVTCETDELHRTQRVMTELFSDVRKKTLLEEAGSQGEGIAYEKLTADLDAGQDAFMKYMDAECAFEVHSFGSGTFGADADVICRIDLLTARISLLKSLDR